MQSVANGRGRWIAALSALQRTGIYHLARRISMGLLTVKAALLVALLCLLVVDAAINRAHAETAQEARQASLDDMLRIDAAATIADFRVSCAAGKSAALISRGIAMGVTSLPNAVDLCITALIRTGRDGVLRPLRSPDGRVTPSLALDTGFVAGFSKGGSVAALPQQEVLRAPAQGCLGQTLNDVSLCYSIGYTFGVRAANGETMRAG